MQWAITQCAKPTGFEPAQGGPKAPQAQKFTVKYTTSTLFWLAQPAHSRLFVPAQQIASLRSPPASNFIFLRVLGSRGKSMKAHGVRFSQFLSDSTSKLTQTPFGFAHWLWERGEKGGASLQKQANPRKEARKQVINSELKSTGGPFLPADEDAPMKDFLIGSS